VSQVSWSIEIACWIIIPINDGFYCILVVNLLVDDLNYINDTDSLMLLLLLALFWALKMCPILALLNFALFGVFFHNSLNSHPPVWFIPASLPLV
jgi:hypothetical protein